MIAVRRDSVVPCTVKERDGPIGVRAYLNVPGSTGGLLLDHQTVRVDARDRQLPGSPSGRRLAEHDRLALEPPASARSLGYVGGAETALAEAAVGMQLERQPTSRRPERVLGGSKDHLPVGVLLVGVHPASLQKLSPDPGH